MTTLSIHNNLTKRKEAFTPIDARNVRMYVCGMTVYDYCHVGHARVLVVFDMVYRYLRALYGAEHVRYVRNVTDIDDKIIQRANERGEPVEALTGRFIDAMHEDADRLGVLRPEVEPRATLHIDQIVAMIHTLIDKGYAYAATNGDVYYDVSRFEGYGKLSGKHPEDLRAGARVQVDEAKDDPLDFVLWKAAKPGEPSWPSPWGAGRPGWHIECSAMSTHCLGDHFDIHGGGLDLQFPHHENEIAQSEAATGHAFVNVWMHNGFVRVDNEKMSKSLGNFFTVREVLERYHPEVLRYFVLASHYRSPLNYSDTHLEHAKAALTSLYTTLRDLPAGEAPAEDPHAGRFHAAMRDDFNTPEALAVLFELSHAINRARSEEPARAASLAALLRELGATLGLLQLAPEAYFQAGDGARADQAQAIDRLVSERDAARAARDWATADRIRDQLKDMGVAIEDAAGGSRWRWE
ncbi:cysteine--tRNA ligase [Ectothiorhodospiraceae bacterium 2226]|nr:cysteine--tRNA ligase [Ectothiorhodospiraceae bacterium 2226]